MVFVFRDGGFIKCDRVDFEDEERFREVLSKLIMEDRNLLLPKSIEDERQSILFLVKEFGVASGSIDLLGIDSEGFIYIVETKLYRSSERRRALAQAIDYASALWSEYSNDVDSFIERLKENSDFNLSAEDIENVKDNIRNGGLRLVVAMDNVDEITKNAINFLNEMCEFDVYALSLERYRSIDNVEVVIPRLYPESQPIKDVKNRKWNWEKFFEDAKNRGFSGTQLESLKRIYDFSVEITKGRGGIIWGRGRKYGTFRVRMEDLFEGNDIYLVDSHGYLQINMVLLYPDQFKTSESANKRIESVNRFAEQLYKAGILSELITSENYREAGKRYPSVRPEKWMNKIEEFQQAVTELINNMKKIEN